MLISASEDCANLQTEVVSAFASPQTPVGFVAPSRKGSAHTNPLHKSPACRLCEQLCDKMPGEEMQGPSTSHATAASQQPAGEKSQQEP